MSTATKINVKYIPTESKVWVHRYIDPPSAFSLWVRSTDDMLETLFKEVFWR